MKLVSLESLPDIYSVLEEINQVYQGELA
jgi:hypothetical protein